MSELGASANNQKNSCRHRQVSEVTESEVKLQDFECTGAYQLSRIKVDMLKSSEMENS